MTRKQRKSQSLLTEKEDKDASKEGDSRKQQVWQLLLSTCTKLTDMKTPETDQKRRMSIR
jgi:hypothetical protein